MSNIQPFYQSDGLPARQSRAVRMAERRLSQSLANIEVRTMIGIAKVHGEGMLAQEKMREIDRITTTAMVGQAVVTKYAELLAEDDPALAMSLSSFVAAARLGKLQVLANTIDAFQRQGF